MLLWVPWATPANGGNLRRGSLGPIIDRLVCQKYRQGPGLAIVLDVWEWGPEMTE